MAILNLIINIIKALTQIKTLISAIKLHKGKSIILAIALTSMTITFFLAVEEHKNKMPYNIIKESDTMTKYIDSILIKCSDKTAISISVINIEKAPPLMDHWLGRFYLARACDAREKDRNCIVNLKDIHPSLYAMDQKIDVNSYGLFVRLGEQTLASRFYLRDKNNKQDLSALFFYPSIRSVVESTNWYKENDLHNLWLTSIISRDKTVLYIITLLSAKSMSKSSCLDQDNILNKIKEFIIYQ